MNMRIVKAIARKDIRAITSTPQVWLGLVLLPLIFGVVLPCIIILVAKYASMDESKLKMIFNIINKMPESATKETLQQMPGLKHQLIYIFTNYMLAAFFLLIPVLNALMIAINSFVGEKERRTLESLLFAPMNIKDLFVGKVLASFIPAYAVTLISFVLCGVLVDALTYSMFDRLIFPNWNWIALILWVAPMFTILTILVSVLVSARTKGFQEAQQLGGLVVLPIVALVISQVTGLLLLNPAILLIIGAVVLIIDVILLQQISKMNQRHILFERQVH